MHEIEAVPLLPAAAHNWRDENCVSSSKFLHTFFTWTFFELAVNSDSFKSAGVSSEVRKSERVHKLSRDFDGYLTKLADGKLGSKKVISRS